MNALFDEAGCLNIDDLIMQQPSFRKIVEDGVVTADEIAEQTQRVISILKKIEQDFSPEQIEIIRELLSEISVLVAVNEISKENAV